MNADQNEPESTKVVLYQAADGKVTVNVTFAREDFWLTQKAMVDLFGVKIPAINKHLKNIEIVRVDRKRRTPSRTD